MGSRGNYIYVTRDSFPATVNPMTHPEFPCLQVGPGVLAARLYLDDQEVHLAHEQGCDVDGSICPLTLAWLVLLHL